MYFWDELNSDDYINRGEEKSHADASAILNLCRGRNNGCYGMVHKSGWFEFMNMPISAAYHPKYHTTIPILCAKQGNQQNECTNFKFKVEEASHISLLSMIT
jgi:hypothetical protein